MQGDQSGVLMNHPIARRRMHPLIVPQQRKSKDACGLLYGIRELNSYLIGF